jgi:hypothetical protein
MVHSTIRRNCKGELMVFLMHSLQLGLLTTAHASVATTSQPAVQVPAGMTA